VEPAPVLVPAVPVLPDGLEPVWPALSAPLVDWPGVADVPGSVLVLPGLVLLVVPVPLVPLWPLIEPVLDPVLELDPVPELDCAIIHALASTRIAKT
jgi:hypothetical protein